MVFLVLVFGFFFGFFFVVFFFPAVFRGWLDVAPVVGVALAVPRSPSVAAVLGDKEALLTGVEALLGVGIAEAAPRDAAVASARCVTR